MANFSYISCIKIAGCPILPPLITDSLRIELQKYKEAAVLRENELSMRRLSEAEKNSDSNDATLQSGDCSEGTVKLMEYIKLALQDVSQDRDVSDLQSQIFEELKKCETMPTTSEQAEPAVSTSGDTMDVLDASTISSDTEKAPASDGSGPSPEMVVTPVRRRSFTLEAPSPAFIKYLQTQNGTPQKTNETWSSESSYLDMSGYTAASGSVSEPRSSVSVKSPPKKSPVKGALVPKKFTPSEEASASKIQAGIRGYLTRRLLRTNKVIDLKKTIRDSLVCALKLHSEQTVTPADVTLHLRLVRQVTAACYELHSIFFDWPVSERMALIRQDRAMALRALAKKRLSFGELKSPVTSDSLTPRDGIMYASFPSAAPPSLSYQGRLRRAGGEAAAAWSS